MIPWGFKSPSPHPRFWIKKTARPRLSGFLISAQIQSRDSRGQNPRLLNYHLHTIDQFWGFVCWVKKTEEPIHQINIILPEVLAK